VKRKAYIILENNSTVKINTLYIAQKTIDLTQLSKSQVIDLVNVKVVTESYMDEHPFIARIWEGDGTTANPFSLAIESRQIPGGESNINRGFVARGDSINFEVNI
jgi:hypothetical protein